MGKVAKVILPIFIFGGAMGKIKFYRIDLDYIKYMWSFDKKVQYNEREPDSYNEKRPYIGIVQTVNGFDYFVPLEHPRPAHLKIKDNIHILKIQDGRYGLIAFNNMIPVKPEQLISFNFSDESIKYQNILKNQFIFCDNNKRLIYDKAIRTFKKVVEDKQAFFIQVCCDFRLLEEKCDGYNKI